MYNGLKPSQITGDFSENFKLCYIEEVERYDYDRFGNEIELFDDSCEYFELFFTNCDMDKQWGDDWNDAPYDCNAGWPYDEHYEGDKRIAHEIIRTKLCLKRNNGDGCAYYYNLPKDIAYNSPYTVEMINAGIVPWLYISSDKDEITPGSKYVIIRGGDTMKSVLEKLEKFVNYP